MTPEIILGIIELLKWAVPEIEKDIAAGLIPVEKQQQVKDAFVDLADHLDEKFSAPEWQIDPDPKPATPTVVVNVNPPVK